MSSKIKSNPVHKKPTNNDASYKEVKLEAIQLTSLYPPKSRE